MSDSTPSSVPPAPPTAATGEHTTTGRPHSFSSITPFLVLDDVGTLLAFCRDVLDAEISSVTEFQGPDGEPMIVHAEIVFDCGRIQAGVPNPDYGLIERAGDGFDASYSLSLYVPNVDETVARAVAAGASVREPVITFVSGDRFASVVDPSGTRWTLMTRVEDLSDEESAARVAAWAAGQNVG